MFCKLPIAEGVQSLVAVAEVGDSGMLYLLNLCPDFQGDFYSRIGKISVGNSLKTIGKDAFRRCGIVRLELPESLTDIGVGAFQGSSLKRVNIPNCVEEIKEQTFYDCDIDTLTLGTRVSYIADAVNRKISVLYVSNPTPPTVEPQEFDYVFTNVYVPEESLEKYRNAEIWENFWNMQGFNVTGIEKVTVDKGKKGECYNLQGIKNSSPVRGLNIIDGKKVVVK